MEDNSVLLFSELMDSASLFLTGNCDTVYFLSFVDLTAGPMVIDVPPLGPPSGILGTIDDMWFRWVTDFGLPGPDRAQGGRYLIVGPGYDGPLPDSGFHVSHARTTRVCVLGRAFMVDNDPRIPVETIRSGFRISPYVPGAQGTAVATFLAGKAPLGAPSAVPETRFVEGSGVAVNTIPPNDFGYWETINALVQQEPAGAGDPETMGLLAAVGIVKGQPFKPDQRMRKILEDAVAVGNATARTISFAPAAGGRLRPTTRARPGSTCCSPAAISSSTRRRRSPPTGSIPVPSDGARKLNSRIAFFYPATGITPAMCMRLTGIGSQYLIAMRDSGGEFLDGGRSYRLTLPPGIPESRFWSVIL